MPILLGILLVFCTFPHQARADSIIDVFNLAPFVPLVLNELMEVSSKIYDFFLGHGTGIIYILIYIFVVFNIALYAFKMFLPKDWLGFFGFSDGGDLWAGKDMDTISVMTTIVKPCLRAVIAVVVLLQVRPTLVTKYLVNPFLSVGSVYTEEIINFVNNSIPTEDIPDCSTNKLQEWGISKTSCEFLVQPVYVISYENNRVIKQGFHTLKEGLRGLMTLIPRGGRDIMNVITGLMIIATFVSANLFMALLIIQAIFDLSLAIIMYPFSVLGWVVKKSDKWLDVLPVFNQLLDALKNLLTAMIGCAFMLCINVASVKALLGQNYHYTFDNIANGAALSNVPQVEHTTELFGNHSLIWLSSLLTIFLLHNIFEATRERLKMYTSGTSTKMYDTVMSDTKIAWGKAKAAPDKVKNIINIVKKLKK